MKFERVLEKFVGEVLGNIGGVLEEKSRRSPSVVRRSPSRVGIFVTNGMP